MKTLLIIGRRWFQRSYGNTYHTAEIFIDGKMVYKTPRQYGYGSQYEETAIKYLEDQGLIPQREKYENGCSEAPFRLFERLGIEYNHEALDVMRKKDL